MRVSLTGWVVTKDVHLNALHRGEIRQEEIARGTFTESESNNTIERERYRAAAHVEKSAAPPRVTGGT